MLFTNRFLPVCSLILATIFCTSATAQTISTQGKHFVDEHGAKIIFRGYNIQSKAPPFQPIQSANELDILQDMGANLIRLNFVWEAAEPEPGFYDPDYFDYYDRVIDWAWQRGMHVLIDFHNNAFSRYAAKGCGSGFPRWALSPDVLPVEPRTDGSCIFNSAMLQAMLSADNYTHWRDFMTDRRGVRTRFFELTRLLAEKYADHPAVIGFDLNEPMVFQPILQYDSALANVFFNDWQQFIMAIDPRYITFFGDSPFQFIFINQPPHLDIPPTGQVSFDAHFYEAGASSLGRPLFGTATSINAIVATREKYGIPVLVGEFGVNLKGRHNHDFQYQMDQVLRHFDREQLSSTRWNYTPHWNPVQKDHFHDEDFSCFDDQDQVRESCAPRASLQQLSGDLISIDIHRKGEAKLFIPLVPRLSDRLQYSDTRVDIRWQHQPEQGATRIFAARQRVFGGGTVTIETEGDDLHCRYDEDERYVQCTSAIAGEKRVVISGP